MLQLTRRAFGALLAALLGSLGAGPVQAAFVEPLFVNATLEGCRLPAGSPLPASLVCADADYTTGNLGKSWNELDLVPFRLTTSLGTQASATTAYSMYVAADYKAGGFLGYDVITEPKVNVPKSHASCTITPVGGQVVIPAPTGGTDETVYREVAITQNKGSTCVFDWVQRLAIGAAQFSGSNLQAYIFDKAGLSGGKKTVPIPVKEIQPQKLSKTMAASQNAERAWNLTKSSNPASIDFGDVCKASDHSQPTEKSVQITVSWTRLAATPGGDVTVITNVNVLNPAARSIDVSVTDKVYTGQDNTGTLLATLSHAAPVPAFFNGLFKTFTYTIPAAQAGSIGSWLNDVAEASYSDPVTNVPIVGKTTAVAKAQVQAGSTLNETANIADTEDITGLGLSFKVATPSVGNFVGYTPPNLATQVKWEVTGLNADGSVTFAKTIVLDKARITTGELTDTATLVTTDTQYTTSASLIPVTISSSATVTVTVKKVLPIALKSGESVVVDFVVTRTDGSGTPQPVSVTFTGPTAINAEASSAPLTGLDPAKYTVTEGNSTFYAAVGATGAPLALVPDQAQKEVDLSPKAGGVMDASNCSGSARFVNTIGVGSYPKAQVAKITDPAVTSGPDFLWTFTLSGPPNFVGETLGTVGAGQPAATFSTPLTEEGTYTITETVKAGWDLTSVVLPDGSTSATKTCTFVVDFPASFDKTYGCTFTNTKRGKVEVVKTVNRLSHTQQFTFQLRSGASNIAEGTALETRTTNVAPDGSTLFFTTLLIPGNSYQMCESVAAGWMTTFASSDPLFVPNAFQPPTGSIPNPNVDNSWLCNSFKVTAGQTLSINVDNAPPPGGRGLTIGYWKTHASCTTSSTNKDVALDRQLFNSTGILKSSKIDSLTVAGPGPFGLYGQTAASTVDCPYAVRLLDKRDFNGTKKASDPLFNMVAQLVAAELNLAAGAYTCPTFATVVQQAEGLLATKAFTGFGYAAPKLTSAQASLANSLATKLDNYNNNRPGVCP